MEANRIEDVARDGIQTTSHIVTTIAQSSGEAAGNVAVALGGAVTKAVRETAQAGEQSGLAACTAIGRVVAAARDVSEQLMGFARSALTGWIDVAGLGARSAIRAVSGVGIELVDAVRSTAAAVVLVRHDAGEERQRVLAPSNGGVEMQN